MRGHTSAYIAGLAVLCAGCQVASIGGLHWKPGQAPGSQAAIEVGPLRDADGYVVPSGQTAAFRLEGFGGTRIALAVHGEGAHLFLEGPLGSDDDREPSPGEAPLVREVVGDGARLVEPLPPGVFRVVVGADAGRPPARLSAECLADCTRSEIELAGVAHVLARDGLVSRLVEAVAPSLAALAPDAARAQALTAELAARAPIAAAARDGEDDTRGFRRFPTLSLEGGASRPRLGLYPEKVEPEAVLHGALVELLGGCDGARPDPAPLSEAVPGLGYGHFPDRALTRCQATRSERLARILDALAAGNGSTITYRDRTLATPLDLVQALLDAGHQVEVRQQRSYANQLPLTWGVADVRWPVWLDTGIPLDTGALVVPLGHCHHTFVVRGPDVSAQVRFYLGPGGAGFFADTDAPPSWTGGRTHDASSDPQLVLATIDAATRLVERSRREADAAGYGAGDDGALGGSTDSSALLELLMRGTVSAFPLWRAAALEAGAAGEIDDGLEAALAALPHDADTPPDRSDALTRILNMLPTELDSAELPDDLLRAQMRAVSQEVLGY